MSVEAHEIRQRLAARVGALTGFREADAPFDPSSSSANFADRPFAVLVPQTLPNGSRSRSGDPMEVKTRAVVRVQAPVNLMGPERVAALDAEIAFEALLVRELMRQGDPWMFGLRVAYAGTERAEIPGEQWFNFDHAFDIGHTVQL